MINQVNDGKASATARDIASLKRLFETFLMEILGIRAEIVGENSAGDSRLQPFKQAVDLLLELRNEAKSRKDWATSDAIRDRLTKMGFDVKDTKDGVEWSIKNNG